MSASASSGTFSLICIVSFKTVIYWLTMNLPHRRKAGTFEIVFYFTSADVGQRGERYARALFSIHSRRSELAPAHCKEIVCPFYPWCKYSYFVLSVLYNLRFNVGEIFLLISGTMMNFYVYFMTVSIFCLCWCKSV